MRLVMTTGFARSGAGKDEQRAFGGFNGISLFWIQLFDERLRQEWRPREGSLV